MKNGLKKRRVYRTGGQGPGKGRGPITVHFTEAVPTRSANGILCGNPLCQPGSFYPVAITWRKVNCTTCLSVGGRA